MSGPDVPSEPLEIGAAPDAVPAARHFTRSALSEVDPAVAYAAELAVSELVTNALLHAGPPVRLRVDAGPVGTDDVRIEVHDHGRSLPVRPLADAAGMTGRGLALVDAVAHRWGVEPLADGKVVWAELDAQSVIDAAPGDVDLEALLDAFDDDRPSTDGRVRYRVELGDVPTDLLIAAKAHVDSLIRELTLSSVGAASGVSASLPTHLVELIHSVVTEFSEARDSIKRQALAAAERGDPRTTLSLSLPVDAADSGERYLAALTEADSHALASRLLTLAAPPQHQAFRRWYVTSLVQLLRAAAHGDPLPTLPSFETHLLRQVDELAQLQVVSSRAARLQRVTAALAAALSVEEAAHLALTDAMAELAAVRGVFFWPGPEGPVALASGGYDEATLAVVQRRWAEGVDMPSVRAYRTGEPVWVETREQRDAHFPALAEADRGVIATCAVPLCVADRVVGVVRLSFLEPRMFSHDERAFLQALAAVGSQALDRISLYEEKAVTADRLTRLQSVAAALAKTRSVDEALEVTIRHARGLIGARIASVSLVDDDGSTVQVRRVEPPIELSAQLQTFTIDADLPAAHVIRTGAPVVIRSVADRNEKWPALASLDWGFDHSLVVLPLLAEDAPIGSLTLSFALDADASSLDQSFLMAFADACAQAVERARAADRAAAANRRLQLLAAASEQLASTLDVERTLASVARLAVPDVADWCVVHLLINGELSAVAIEHADPAKLTVALSAQERWPQRMAGHGGVAQVIRSGAPLLIPDIAAIPPEQRGEIDPEYAAVIEELGFSSVIIVPLLARGRTLGALTLIASDASRRYNASDLAFAEDLARRAGMAIETATLFRESTSEAAGRIAGGASAPGGIDAGRALAEIEIGRFSMRLVDRTIEFDSIIARLFALEGADETAALQLFMDRIHPDDRDRVDAAISDAVERRGEYGVEYRAVLPDGSLRWIVGRGRVLVDDAGAPSTLTGVAYESTGVRHGAGDELARLLETMSDAFFRLDREWRFTYINSQAERLLFRGRAELLGRNVWDEFPDGRNSAFESNYQLAVSTGQPTVFEEYFAPLEAWFEVRAMPDPEGLSVFFHDVTARRTAEQQRFVAAERLALLAEAARGLVGTLDMRAVLEQVTSVVVPRLASWAFVVLLDSEVGDTHGVLAPSDGGPAGVAIEWPSGEVLDRTRLARAAMSDAIVWDVEPTALTEMYGSEISELAMALSTTSLLVAPLPAGQRSLGLLFLGKSADAAFSAEDRDTASDIGRRAGLALENARLYERQRTASEVLQRSLLTPLPEPDRLEISARYLPAGQEAQVGGDWYDGFLQPNGATVLVIGDVVGHDMNAAAAMGQLRNLLRGISYDTSDSPARVLARVDTAIRGLQVDTLATAVVARIEQTAEQRARSERTLRWSNAGHPPPMVVTGAGEVLELATDDDLLLGLDPDLPRHDHVVTLAPGDTLLLFTDGLVERRDSPIEEGLDRLREALRDVWHLPLEDLCTELVTRLLPENADDDVAIVALRALPQD